MSQPVRLLKEPDHFGKIARSRKKGDQLDQEWADMVDALHLAAKSLDEEIKSFLPPSRQMWDDVDRAKYKDWNGRRQRYRKLRKKLVKGAVSEI